jgi:hypothetical protein
METASPTERHPADVAVGRDAHPLADDGALDPGTRSYVNALQEHRLENFGLGIDHHA